MKNKSIKPIIENLESLFSKFNDYFYNNELQQPVITVSPENGKYTYGWCTCYKVWKEKTSETVKLIKTNIDITSIMADKEGYYEINVCADSLCCPLSRIAETLLHEMAHLYNLQIGVKDTSRNGTYHNNKYKLTAETHGLNVEKDSTCGFTITTLNDEAQRFIESLQLEDMPLFRVGKLTKSNCSKQSTRRFVCPKCFTVIRATKKKVNVICGDCNVPFVEATGKIIGE